MKYLALLLVLGCAASGERARPLSPLGHADPPPASPAAPTQPEQVAAPPPRHAPDRVGAIAAPPPPSLDAYRESIARVLSPSTRAELSAAPAQSAQVEAACHRDVFSAVLGDAVARNIAAPAFRALGPPYLAYAKLATDALPMQAHTAVEWNNFAIASPALDRCEDSEPSPRTAAFCARAQLADEIGTAVATGFSPDGVAQGGVPTGDGTSEDWSISLDDVLAAALQLGVSRARAERALIDAYRRMRVKLEQPCELLERERHAVLVPVVLHVAARAGAPVVAEAELRDWLAVADDHFAPAAIAFAPEVRALAEGFGELRTVRDRHALKRFLVPRSLNVFIVSRMLDPVASTTTKRAAAWQGFEPSGQLAGAHIEADGHQPGTYVIISAEHGGALSLTHELGHFFGVAHHRDPTNIMSYGAERSAFDETQLETFRRKLRALLRAGALE